MMEPLNYTAIGAGTIASFIAGWIVYSPRVFGQTWATGSGITLPEGGPPPVLPLVAQFVALLLMATVVGLTAQINALGTAIAAIVAAAALVVSNGAFSGKSGAALAIDGGYVVLAGALMIVAQGVF